MSSEASSMLAAAENELKKVFWFMKRQENVVHLIGRAGTEGDGSMFIMIAEGFVPPEGQGPPTLSISDNNMINSALRQYGSNLRGQLGKVKELIERAENIAPDAKGPCGWSIDQYWAGYFGVRALVMGFVDGSWTIAKQWATDSISKSPTAGMCFFLAWRLAREGNQSAAMPLAERGLSISDFAPAWEKGMPQLRESRPASSGSYRPPSGGSSGGCFIATAAAGQFSDEVLILQEFRDTRLACSKLGRAFVEFYYTVGPAGAWLISRSETLKRIVLLFCVRPAAAVARAIVRSKQRQ